MGKFSSSWLFYDFLTSVKAIMALGYGLMIMLDEKTSLAAQLLITLVSGLGFGGLFHPPLIGMQAAMPIKDMATSTATFGLIRQIGATIGTAIGQAVWSSVSARLSQLLSLVK
jgi:hypothetical protein